MDPVSIQAMDHMLLLVNDVHNKWVTHSPHTHTHSFAPCSQAVLEDDSLSFKGFVWICISEDTAKNITHLRTD